MQLCDDCSLTKHKDFTFQSTNNGKFIGHTYSQLSTLKTSGIMLWGHTHYGLDIVHEGPLLSLSWVEVNVVSIMACVVDIRISSLIHVNYLSIYSVWIVSYCHVYEQGMWIYKVNMAFLSPHNIRLWVHLKWIVYHIGYIKLARTIDVINT